MARTRSVKPSFFGDCKLADETSRDVRLLYIGLWQLMDRRGVMEYHPKEVKRSVFPFDDDVTAAVIENWIVALARAGRLRVVHLDGKRYIHCPHLPKHQSFHRDEKPNPLLPEAVITAPEEIFPAKPKPEPYRYEVRTVPAPSEHRADTVPAPSEHEANRSGIWYPESENRNLVEDSGARARARDEDVGVDDRLADLALGSFLDDVEHGAQRSWIDTYGIDEVRRHLPDCRARWVSDTARKSPSTIARLGGKGAFVTRWLKNARDNPKPASVMSVKASADDIAARLKARDAETAG